MRNESSRALVERVNAAQQASFFWQIDIDGLNIDYSVKTLILKCYEARQPFGLRAEEGENTVYYFPSNCCAFWCDDDQVTLNMFQSHQQFEDCLKLALVAHRKFISVRQLEGEERFKEICYQLIAIG